MMNSSNPYSQMLQQQMGAQVQPQPMQAPPPIQMPQRQPPKQGGGMLGGMMGGAGGGGMMAMSDEHSKKEIARLSSANDALTKALGGATGAPADSRGTTEYPSMPANTRFQPSGRHIPGSPGEDAERKASMGNAVAGAGASDNEMSIIDRLFGGNDGPANKVAAQNVGLSPEQPLPPPAQQPPARPGFDPRRPEFDMSALDEAYRRSGTTPGT